jgi:hypothetical protein
MEFRVIKPYPEGSTARFLQETPIAGIDLLEAAKEAIQFIPNTAHPARQRLQGAIDLIDMRHAPRRAMEVL